MGGGRAMNERLGEQINVQQWHMLFWDNRITISVWHCKIGDYNLTLSDGMGHQLSSLSRNINVKYVCHLLEIMRV